MTCWTPRPFEIWNLKTNDELMMSTLSYSVTWWAAALRPLGIPTYMQWSKRGATHLGKSTDFPGNPFRANNKFGSFCTLVGTFLPHWQLEVSQNEVWKFRWVSSGPNFWLPITMGSRRQKPGWRANFDTVEQLNNQNTIREPSENVGRRNFHLSPKSAGCNSDSTTETVLLLGLAFSPRTTSKPVARVFHCPHLSKWLQLPHASDTRMRSAQVSACLKAISCQQGSHVATIRRPTTLEPEWCDQPQCPASLWLDETWPWVSLPTPDPRFAFLDYHY